MKWAYWASKRGDIYAQYYMGHGFAFGRDLPQDYIEAFAWLSLSVDSEIHSLDELVEQYQVKCSAEDLIRHIQNEMTAEEIMKSKERIDRYKEKLKKDRMD
ncbi:MAG: SEL1-like repeat protein [Pontiellaceae bacterium]|nr:SEL1-like repeat protein [Pontiellaceae bacterium]